MITRGYRRIVVAAVAALVVLVTGCGRTKLSATGGASGTVGESYIVTVLRPTGGTVTAPNGVINCGTAPTSNVCGPVSLPWSQSLVLTATADPGNMFGTWAGDCTGRGETSVGTYQCTLSTTPYGADKYVVAVFGPSGLTQHTNFSDHTVHGPAYIDFATGKPDTFSCPSCHGATYNGMGIAPSCNACHAKAGHPGWQTDCKFCHGAPPPPAPPGYTAGPHPAAQVTGTAPPALCSDCHGTTVDANGVIIPKSQGGTHLNGQLDGGGHEPGFANPAVHGREFFGVANDPSPNYCQKCHGTDYGRLIVSPVVPGDPNRSCNVCHATAGWLGGPPAVPGSGWQTNCSFCHGVKSAATQQGPYDVNASGNATRSAPPDAISQRLTGAPAPDRTGAHAAHLTATWAKVQCGACHAVPATTSHISGKDVRAAVIVTAPGKAPSPSAYDPATHTCATYCHDPIGNGATPSPAWTVTGLACNGCHPVPPATSAHVGLTGLPANLGAECSGCHPDTINPDGSFNSVAGGHINGMVDSPAGHAAGFFLPANHGSQFLNTLAGVAGSLNCTSCHTGYANCNACHSNPAGTRPELAGYTIHWVSWQSNCTFCHGDRTAAYTSANLADCADTAKPCAAPPAAIQQRFDNIPVPDRDGQHRSHLANLGIAPAGPLPCGTCHAVPSTFDHVTADRRAAVALDAARAFPNLAAADLAKLPSPLGVYQPATGSCASYCHGSPHYANAPNVADTGWGGNNTSMLWTNDPNFATIISGSCVDCHGQPPPTGKLNTSTGARTFCSVGLFPNGCDSHTLHARANTRFPYLYDGCANCHWGSAASTGNIAGLHVNGKADIVFTPPGTTGYKSFTVTPFDSAYPITCTTSCHQTSGTGTARTWY